MWCVQYQKLLVYRLFWYCPLLRSIKVSAVHRQPLTIVCLLTGSDCGTVLLTTATTCTGGKPCARNSQRSKGWRTASSPAREWGGTMTTMLERYVFELWCEVWDIPIAGNECAYFCTHTRLLYIPDNFIGSKTALKKSYSCLHEILKCLISLRALIIMLSHSICYYCATISLI